jgi:sortase A
MTRTALRWLQWMLLALGVVLGVWSATSYFQMEQTRRMPVPPPPLTITQTLPDGAKPTEPAQPPPPVQPPARGEWLARLEAPSVRLTATVLEGSDDATLKRGAGHIEDTPLPGQTGNVGIAGHRDTTFRALRRVKVGDPLDLTTRDRVYHYRIAQTSIVSPKSVEVLDPTAEPTLTLVTCYPFEFLGHAPKRFIIQARLVNQETRTVPAE